MKPTDVGVSNDVEEITDQLQALSIPDLMIMYQRDQPQSFELWLQRWKYGARVVVDVPMCRMHYYTSTRFEVDVFHKDDAVQRITAWVVDCMNRSP